jgi:hypothetical protein
MVVVDGRSGQWQMQKSHKLFISNSKFVSVNLVENLFAVRGDNVIVIVSCYRVAAVINLGALDDRRYCTSFHRHIARVNLSVSLLRQTNNSVSSHVK